MTEDEEHGGREAWAEAVKDRMDREMKRRGLSQRALGKLVGVSGSAIAQRTARETSLGQWWALYRLCKALGASADALLGLTPGPAQPAPDRRELERALREADEAASLSTATSARIRKALGVRRQR